MKGVIFAQQGAAPQVVDNLEKPKPASDQILVKSLWTAINPVDAFLSGYGILVLSWPLVLSVDASGVVVEAGSDAQSKYGFKVGDYVCGCTRLGTKGHSAGQEYFLMDAAVTIPKPKNLDVVQAATLGVGIETAALGVFDGLKIDLPDPSKAPQEKDEWVVVLGGASSVGKFAIQLAKAAGYKVIASCSSNSKPVVEDLGAKTFDYKASIDEQVQQVLTATGNNVGRIFDAMASDNPEIAVKLFKKSTAATKLFSTTGNWGGLEDYNGEKPYGIMLGVIGRPDAAEVNATLEKYIPVLKSLVESDAVKPSDYHVVGNGGFEDVIEAFRFQQSGKGGSKKVVVKVQDE